MAKGLVIPVDQFVREWVRSAAAGETSDQLAARLKQQRQSVTKRARELREKGIALPELARLTSERDTLEVAKEALAQAMEEFYG